MGWTCIRWVGSFHQKYCKRGCGFTVFLMGGIKGLNLLSQIHTESKHNEQFHQVIRIRVGLRVLLRLHRSSLRERQHTEVQQMWATLSSSFDHSSDHLMSNCLLYYFRFNCHNILDHSSSIYWVFLLDFVVYITLKATSKVSMKMLFFSVTL